jgi:ribonuclease P protein component
VTASVPAKSNGESDRETPQNKPHTAEERGKRSFSRSGRLLRHADFERVYKLGRRHFSPSMTVFYWKRDEAGDAQGVRVGFTVSKALGGAVDRNRMRRRLREAVRLTRARPAVDVDVVINPKKVVLTAGFDTLLNEVRQAFVVIEEKTKKTKAEGRDPKTDSRTPDAGRREPSAGSQSK